MDDLGLLVSLAVFGVGVVLLAAAGIWFRLRAIANRKAWNGGTLPLALTGLVFAGIGLVLIYLNYQPGS
ncbi:MAG: hypothetical protein LBE08_11830 [Bifidobacteriaceae bacterium]|nr:hypothetical protein [Bifidobacteriaceae bacterium]